MASFLIQNETKAPLIVEYPAPNVDRRRAEYKSPNARVDSIVIHAGCEACVDGDTLAAARPYLERMVAHGDVSIKRGEIKGERDSDDRKRDASAEARQEAKDKFDRLLAVAREETGIASAEA